MIWHRPAPIEPDGAFWRARAMELEREAEAAWRAAAEHRHAADTAFAIIAVLGETLPMTVARAALGAVGFAIGEPGSGAGSTPKAPQGGAAKAARG